MKWLYPVFGLFCACLMLNCKNARCNLLNDCNSTCPTLIGPAKIAGWTVEKVPMNRSDLTSFTFPDTLVGFAKSFNNGRFFKTADGGKTWSLMKNLPISNSINFGLNDALFFLNKNEGWVAQPHFFFFQDQATIKQVFSTHFLKTTDGGDSWNTVGDSLIGVTESLVFQDNLRGWAVRRIDSTDANGFFYQNTKLTKTTDGGQTWLDVPSVVPQQFVSKMVFPTAQTGYVLGNLNTIYRTENGGLDWSFSPLPINFATTLLFTDEKTGFVSDGFSQVFKTVDGGKSWFSVFLPASSFNLVQFSDAAHGLALAQSRKCADQSAFGFFGTSNGGQSWEETEPVLNFFGLTRIDFPTPTNGFVSFSTQLLKVKRD